MTEELVSFPTAKLAKQKGFDEECFNFFEWYELDGKEFGPLPLGRKPIDFREWAVPLEETQKRPLLYNQAFAPERNSKLKPWLFARPTLDLLEMWLREVHGMQCTVLPVSGKKYCPIVFYEASDLMDGLPHMEVSFPQAREAAIVHALNLVPDL